MEGLRKFIRSLPYILLGSVLVLSSKVELFSIAGSDKAFTLSNFLIPLSMHYFSPWVGLLLIVLSKAVEKGLAWKLGLFVLPSVASALAFRKRSLTFGIVLPLLGMIAFLSNPAGQSYYILLWVIPIVMYLFPNAFSRAFISTYAAHIVGSVIFLYTFPTSVSFWNMLFGIAFVERLVFALGIVGSAKLMDYSISLANSLSKNLASSSSPTVSPTLREEE